MQHSFPTGLTDESVIATILREALKGIEYLHSTGRIHRDVKAGNLLVHEDGSIKVGDFGVSAWLIEAGMRREGRQTFVGTPCWMAPEVMEQVHGYDYKADIWSLGITALELAKGQAPLAQYPPMRVLLLTLQNPPPSLEGTNFSKSFQNFVETCLQKDPSKRPSASKLLEHKFFKLAKKTDVIQTTLLKNLPPLWDRVKLNVLHPDANKTSSSDNNATSWNFETNGELLETIIQSTPVSGSPTPSVTTSNNLNPTTNPTATTNSTNTSNATTSNNASNTSTALNQEPKVNQVVKGRFTKTVISKVSNNSLNSIEKQEDEEQQDRSNRNSGNFDPLHYLVCIFLTFYSYCSFLICYPRLNFINKLRL